MTANVYNKLQQCNVLVTL